MFGPIMRFEVGELTIELAPLKREDMSLFVTDGGMQSLTVTKYLGRTFAPVEDDEAEWFDKTRQDSNTYAWGIYVVEGNHRTLIGNTSINGINNELMRYGVTGFLIFRPDYWGKGIATACHRARTWFACTQLGLVQLRSAAYDRNSGSCKALKRVGYVSAFHERNTGFADGEFIGMTSFSLINPLESQWGFWWHGDTVPPTYLKARQRTLRALEWSEEHVSF